MKFIIGGVEGKRREKQKKTHSEFNKYNFPISTFWLEKRKVQGLFILLTSKGIETYTANEIMEVSTREVKVRESQNQILILREEQKNVTA